MDRISNLPSSVLENIIERIPSIEAVRTCVLSREWRNKWKHLSKLVFHGKDLPNDIINHLVALIHNVLLFHQGQIHQFELDIAQSRLEIHLSDLESWINILARNDIKELIIAFNPLLMHIIPSSLFSCQQLTHLELKAVVLVPPNDFDGFKHLKQLKLTNLFVTDSKVFSGLISNCSCLEQLILVGICITGSLNIQALTKLKLLHISGLFTFIIFENCPVLESVILKKPYDIFTNEEDFEPSERFNFVQNLSRLPSLKQLEISSFLLQNWHKRVTTKNIFAVTKVFNYLKINIWLTMATEIRDVLDLLNLFSDLEHLCIKVEYSRGDFPETSEILDVLRRSSLCFNRLRRVDIKLKSKINIDWIDDLQFLEFLLSRSPLLQKLQIVCNKTNYEQVELLVQSIFSLNQSPAEVDIIRYDES